MKAHALAALLATLWTLTMALTACGESQNRGVAPVYDGNTAFVLAGHEMPPGGQDYYLFDFDQGLSANENADEITNTLKQDPVSTRHIGIVGPDAAKNLEALKLFSQASSGKQYSDLNLIYVGPAKHRQQALSLLAPLNANVRYVIYP